MLPATVETPQLTVRWDNAIDAVGESAWQATAQGRSFFLSYPWLRGAERTLTRIPSTSRYGARTAVIRSHVFRRNISRPAQATSSTTFPACFPIRRAPSMAFAVARAALRRTMGSRSPPRAIDATRH
jgi:hypothetical protein